MPSVKYIDGAGQLRERATTSGAGTTNSPDVMQFESTAIGARDDTATTTLTGGSSLIALMKGLITSIGFVGDTAATSDTASASLISLTKRLLTETSALPTMLFVTGTASTATTTAAIAAPGAGVSIYVSFIRVELEGTTAQTITIRDGSTDRIRFYLSSQGSVKDISLAADRELKLTANTALNIVSSAASAFNYTIGYFVL
jgi:hypothetical protein